MLLKPVKVEMLNLNPDLYLLHDVMTDKEINHVIKLARPQVSRLIDRAVNVSLNFRKTIFNRQTVLCVECTFKETQ